jgi:hypothetical protein
LKTPPSSSTPSKGTVEAMPSGSVCCEREPGVDTARRSSAKTCSHHASASVSPSRAFELQSKAKQSHHFLFSAVTAIRFTTEIFPVSFFGHLFIGIDLNCFSVNF